MKRWWVSWIQPGDDERPIYKGDSKSSVEDVEPRILGWWNTGSCEEGATICALMIGRSDRDVLRIIKKYWPDAITRPMRFLVETESDWWPSEGRFPRRDSANAGPKEKRNES